MRVEIERPRPLHPVGIYTFTLAEVSSVQMPSFNDPTQTVERWVWRFVSSKRTEDGDFYEVPVFTGKRYGNSQAKATWLLDLIKPGITIREAEQLDTDELIGLQFEGSVKHETARNDPDKRLATFAYLRPLQSADAELDPFEFDDAGSVITCEWDGCGKELNPKEIAASKKHFGEALKVCSDHGKLALQNKTPAATAA